MKAINANNASTKTLELIRKTFFELLHKYGKIGKIKVSELVERANINRGTFYLHYDNIYGVAEEITNEIVEEFFNQKNSICIDDYLNNITNFVKKNEKTYKLLVNSDFVEIFSDSSKRRLYIEIKKIFKNYYNIQNETNLSLMSVFFVNTILDLYKNYFTNSYNNCTLDDIKIFLSKVLKLYNENLNEFK